MTVKELKERLEKYPDEYDVDILGKEGNFCTTHPIELIREGDNYIVLDYC